MPTRSKVKKKPTPAKPAPKKPESGKKRAAAPPPAPVKAGKAGARPAPAGVTTPYEVADALIESFATSNRITRFLVGNLHEDAWHAAPPVGRGRTIAAIVCHMHNARVMWLESFGKKPKMPKKLDRLATGKDEALKALDLSHAAISKVVGGSLKGDGKIANFKAGGAAFLAYLMTHDAHHRGQICLMAKQIGHPLPQAIGYGMWEWSKR